MNISKEDTMLDNPKDPKVIDAKPTKDLFISILVRDVTIRDAIGDLVDNSVDGALRLRPDGNYSGLEVEIELDPKNNNFKIIDNCGGIPIDVAREYAFRFGRPDKAKDTEYSVGVFGIGMKRALFRLGKKFLIKSVSKKSSFTLEVDVEKWKNEGDLNSNSKNMENWQFVMSEYEEDLNIEYPEEDRGTSIVVTELKDDVKEAFSSELERNDLISEIQREHLFTIDQGLNIKINNTLLEAPELQLLASDKFQTAFWEKTDGPVKVKIYAGISEKEQFGENGGWYLFCNKRLILGPDQTKTTGWGIKKPIKIPQYHSQFYRFRGYVFMEAADPRDLPWNTAKTGLDMDSKVYRAVFQQMVILMRSVIDFLNQVHDEERRFRKEEINETPSQDAIQNSELAPLRKIRKTKTYLSESKFVAPKPAKVSIPTPQVVWFRYSVPASKYEEVKEYFEIDKAGEIGSLIFDYFYSREIEE